MYGISIAQPFVTCVRRREGSRNRGKLAEQRAASTRCRPKSSALTLPFSLVKRLTAGQTVPQSIPRAAAAAIRARKGRCRLRDPDPPAPVAAGRPAEQPTAAAGGLGLAPSSSVGGEGGAAARAWPVPRLRQPGEGGVALRCGAP